MDDTEPSEEKDSDGLPSLPENDTDQPDDDQAQIPEEREERIAEEAAEDESTDAAPAAPAVTESATDEVPPPAAPKADMDHSGGQSRVTDAGANWYGFALTYRDDYGDIDLFATDDRGYLLSGDRGFVNTLVTEIVGIHSTGKKFHGWRVEGWELPNGDVFVQSMEARLYAEHIGAAERFHVSSAYAVYRPTRQGFVRMAKAEKDEKQDWTSEQLERTFADWGLSFNESLTVKIIDNGKKKQFTTLGLDVAAVPGCTPIKPEESYTFEICDFPELRAEGEAHYRAAGPETNDVVTQLLADIAAAGYRLVQQNQQERADNAGQVYEIWKTYGTPAGGTVRIDVSAATGEIVRVTIRDKNKDVVYWKLKEVKALETSMGMKEIYHAVITSPALHISPEASQTLNAYDLEWSETIDETQELSCVGYASAENVSVKFYRQYWRIVNNTLYVSTTIDIQR